MENQNLNPNRPYINHRGKKYEMTPTDFISDNGSSVMFNSHKSRFPTPKGAYGSFHRLNYVTLSKKEIKRINYEYDKVNLPSPHKDNRVYRLKIKTQK